MRYTYRCHLGHERAVEHPMAETPVVTCPEVEHLTLEPTPMQRVIVRPPETIMRNRDHPTRNTRARGLDRDDGYQAHLARFPGDPTALTSGKLGKARLIDQRMREGWVPVPDVPSDAKRPRRSDLAGREPLGERVKREVLTMKQEGRLPDVAPESPDSNPAPEAGDAGDGE